ncbi:4-alpha-glucanotransferase [Salegentibacter chungangensis]|uniref:4-alpha-glucanotransferase n=1 Tax=Salegentibacter chungangensis TaxID=1335724 RepID=A0ABW3NU29_9FLAO
MKTKRSSGILLHITSLHSKFGIGDLGPEAYKFVDFLSDSGYSWWQLLPLNPTGEAYSHSPYSTYSAFAGNALMISPELLEKEGLADLKTAKLPKGIKDKKVKFKPVVRYKEHLLDAAYSAYLQKQEQKKEFIFFCEKHREWLNDYALFEVLRKQYSDNWPAWPEEFRDRKKKDLEKLETEKRELVEKEKFIQYLFFKQWEDLLEYAHSRGVKMLGDIPFYVNHHSADCWANPQYFKLSENSEPEKISGVPPDIFSDTGQLWGTPIYHWKNLRADDYSWWKARLKQNLFLFDLVRLDHFRAFSAFWEVNAGEKTAIHGRWVKAPGTDFFRNLKKEFPEMPFIAEDLGSLDEDVYTLLERFKFPRMKVLQFAFGGHKLENPYLPFNHTAGDVVYTGTHDNNTCKGWYRHTSDKEKQHLKDYTSLKVNKKNVNKVMVDLALKSVAWLAIVPLQDIIGLGESGIMNVPSGKGEHWTWRVSPQEIPVDRTAELKEQNILYGRCEEN